MMYQGNNDNEYKECVIPNCGDLYSIARKK